MFMYSCVWAERDPWGSPNHPERDRKKREKKEREEAERAAAEGESRRTGEKTDAGAENGKTATVEA